jgi:hypothetical protein
MLRRWRNCSLIFVAAFGLYAGCRDIAPTPPPFQPLPVPGRLLSWTPLSNVADPGAFLSQAPTVLVADSTGLIPVAGVVVRFRITAGGGAIVSDSAISDRQGLASVGGWQLGSAPGPDTLVASVTGLPPVMFTARFRVAVAIYDLQTIAGQQVPVTFPWGWIISGGHYVIFDDGSCTWGYEGSNAASPTRMSYQRPDSATIQFYVLPGTYSNSAFYAERNGLFSTGTLNGTTMTVRYEDFLDFDNPEVYVRRTASMNRSAAHLVMP